MLTATPLLSLYIGLFTFYQSRKLWVTLTWMHRISYSPTLKKSPPVWCCASDGQFTLCGASSVSLFCVCSCRVVVVHNWPAWPAQLYRDGFPLSGAVRKSWFQWRTHEHPWSAGFSWGRKGCLLQNLALHFIWFLFLTNPSPFSSPCRHQLYPRPSHLAPVKWVLAFLT